MKRFTTRQIRQALIGKGNLRTLLSDRITDWDPYQPGSRQHLKQIYLHEAMQGWQRIRLLLADSSSVEALENTWASIAHLQELRDFLYAGVVIENDPQTVRRADQLLSIKKFDEDRAFSLGRVLESGKDDTPPDLLDLQGFADELRVRWGLASRVRRRASYLELLQCAGAVQDLEVETSAALLHEALQQREHPHPPRLRQAQATTLTDAEFAILTSDPALFKKMYAQGSTSFSDSVEKVRSLRLKYAGDLDHLKLIFSHLARRDWQQAGQLASEIVPDATAQLAAEQAVLDLGSLAEITSKPTNQRWSAMTEMGHAHLVKLFGKSAVPAHWQLDAEQLANRLMDRRISERSLSTLDILQIGKSWSLEVKKALITAGCYRVLVVSDVAWRGQSISVLSHAASQRPEDGERLLSEHLTDFKNAEEILSALISIGSRKFASVMEQVVAQGLRREAFRSQAMSWEELLSSQIGTSAWTMAVQKGLVKKASVAQLMHAAKQGGPNSSTQAFEAVAVSVLQRIKRANHDDAISVMCWIEARPSDVRFIAPSLSTSFIKKISDIPAGQLRIEPLKALYEASNKEHRALLWQLLLNHVTAADQLIDLALNGAAQGWQTQWLPRWKSAQGSVQQKSRALVLMARNDLGQLRQLRRLFTEEIISEALLWVSQQLPNASSFEKIFLELCSCLGLRHGATLRWLLSNRSREKPAGAKFDHLYTRHEIPKKSGKMRLISAPNPRLKRIQKSIAVSLLDPLGAHDAAFGFVTGKSIVGNARLHVGKTLVVNADVRNCFPSVRWPLVRAALVRDLSHRLSPLTISFVVDLCTSDGVLPVGAPTSPAILNRVLFKTDQILSHQASLRDCAYSRYADDLTFSGGEKAVGMLGVARRVLGQIGLELDPEKTNIFRRGRRQMCTGLVVNDCVNVPRAIRKKIRAAVHAVELGRPLAWGDEAMSSSSLRGRLEFLKMVSPDRAAPLLVRLDAAQAVKPSSKKGMSSKQRKSGRT